MQHNLSDNDRVLLSAYVDGELSAIERQRVEQMLAGSPEAQSYVGDLRALNGLSSAAFPTISLGSAAIGSGSMGKLSGSAIKVAAQKAVLTKGFFGGMWGLAGVATASVVVVAGVALSLKPLPPSSSITETPKAQTSFSSSRSVVATPAMDIDSNSVIVPRITPVELVKFAVKGTLPIDSKRDCYIRLAAGEDLQGGVHEDLNDLDRDLQNFDWHQCKGLDSMQEVVRTAFLNYSGDRIAIRKDIGDLRLKVLKNLELQVAPQFPERTRQQLRIARRKIEAAHLIKVDDQSDDVDQDVDEGEVPYILIQNEQLEGQQFKREIRIPANAFITNGDGHVVVVGGRTLNELRESIESPGLLPSPPSVPQRFFYPEKRQASGASAGTNQPRKNKEPESTPSIQQTPPLHRDEDKQENPPESDAIRQRETPRVIDLDSLMGRARESIDRARNILEDIDVQIELKKGHDGESRSGSGEAEGSIAPDTQGKQE